MSNDETEHRPHRITRWKDVAKLLKAGWTVDGYDLVSPTGERRSAWGNAIQACRKRRLVPKGDGTGGSL